MSKPNSELGAFPLSSCVKSIENGPSKSSDAELNGLSAVYDDKFLINFCDLLPCLFKNAEVANNRLTLIFLETKKTK